MNIYCLMPEIILTLAGLLILLSEAFLPGLRKAFWFVAFFALVAAGWTDYHLAAGVFFDGFIHTSLATRSLDIVIYAGSALAVLFAPVMLKRYQLVRGEFFTLLLWATVGMVWMIRGGNLLAVLIGLELLSICLYVLTGFYRDTDVAPEAALKYFLMGAFASAILMFGIAFYYGMTGSTVIPIMDLPGDPGFMIIVFFILSAFAFKMALFPVHAWAPDVYQGSPSPVTTFLSTLPKLAALVIFIKFFSVLTGPVPTQILTVVSIFTMFVGNLVAIAQRDVKRMLAYSGIAHMGYVLIGVVAGTGDAYAAVFFYSIVYIVMTMTAFAIIGMMSNNEAEPSFISQFSGLGFKYPFHALVLSVCLFSLTGIPPMAGFMAKFSLFKAGIDASFYKLVLIGIVNSIISIYYYIRVVYVMYMKQPDGDTPLSSDFRSVLGAWIALIFLLYVGLFPDSLMVVARNIAGSFFGGW